MESQPPLVARVVPRRERTISLPEELDPNVHALAGAILERLRPLLYGAAFLDWYGRPGTPVGEWSVAMPVAVSRDAAIQPVCGGLPPSDGDVVLPGARLKVVGGTLGHIGWPAASVVFEVVGGLLAGRRVEFLIDPDPRPLGPLAAVCAALVVRADEPLLVDAETLAQFQADVARLIADAGLGSASW